MNLAAVPPTPATPPATKLDPAALQG
ncbi:MAG: hypothetical protein JWM86_921, partial [Thermoleophilia bacterium]|nr:hypothetical protein [Thermoleophilia bacterium]